MFLWFFCKLNFRSYDFRKFDGYWYVDFLIFLCFNSWGFSCFYSFNIGCGSLYWCYNWFYFNCYWIVYWSIFVCFFFDFFIIIWGKCYLFESCWWIDWIVFYVGFNGYYYWRCFMGDFRYVICCFCCSYYLLDCKRLYY